MLYGCRKGAARWGAATNNRADAWLMLTASSYAPPRSGDWGPHLVVVPTSVMLNWEMEFKKWWAPLRLGGLHGSDLFNWTVADWLVIAHPL